MALIQSNSQSSGHTSLAFSISNTVGNFLIAFCNNSFVSSPTISDTLGNTWILIQNITNSVGQFANSSLWYCASCKAGANTVTTNASGLRTVAEFSGVSSLNVTGSAKSTGSGTAWSTNSITTTNPNELKIGTIAVGYGGVTVGSPFIVIGSDAYTALYYEIVSSLQTSLFATGSMSSNISNACTQSLSGFIVGSSTGSSGVFEADGNSLLGWTNVSSVQAGQATSGYSYNDYLSTFLVPAGSHAYINTNINFADCVIEFDVALSGSNTTGYLLFGCTAGGAGAAITLAPMPYGNSGVSNSSSWTSITTTSDSYSSLETTTWTSIKIVISNDGTHANTYISGYPIQQQAITLQGNYLGLYASGGVSVNFANIRVYQS